MKNLNLHDTLKNKISKKSLLLLPRSFDVIGSIAIIDIPKELKKKEKLIGETLISLNKNIQTVLQKAGRIKGRLRTRKLKWIAGLNTKETIHKESGCLFKLDVEKCYFSPRLSNDRIDIAKQVKPGEKVLVMFSGIAPYAIVIAKNTKAKEVYAIELNRIANKYARENVKINKLNNVQIIQGDVKKIIPYLAKKKIKFDMSEINGKISEHAQKQRAVFDRIIMARPQLKDDFLESALKVAKKSTIIHFYDFLREDEMPLAAFAKIDRAIKSASKQKNSKIHNYRLIRWKKALEIGPRKWRIRVDFYVF